MKFRQSLRLAFLLQYIGYISGQSQLTVSTVRVERFTWTIPELDAARMENRARKLENENRNARWNPAGTALFEAAQKATASLFRLDEMALIRRAATHHPALGDVMTVAWDVAIQGVRGQLLLRDSCGESTYHLRLKDLPGERLSALLPQLIGRPITETLTVELMDGPRPRGQFVSRNLYASNYIIINDRELYGTQVGNDWLLEMIIGKGFLRSFYGDTMFVKERIPPLQDRAREWPAARLLAELSDSHYPAGRDGILIREIVRRGPAASELLYMLERIQGTRDPHLIALRYGQIHTALLERDSGPIRAAEFLELSVDLFERIGSRAEEAAVVILRAECAPRHERRSVDWLRKGIFARPALWYLGRCGDSADVQSVIENAVIPEEAESGRTSALNYVRRRAEDRRKSPGPRE